MRVINQCQINYTIVPDNQPSIKGSKMSTEAVSEFVETLITVEKSVNKSTALAYEILLYEIQITNIGSKVANNLYFLDELPEGIACIGNTVKINGTLYNCVTPTAGFSLGDLGTGGIIYISFQAVIMSNSPVEINNEASVAYDYTYNTGEAPLHLIATSNSVATTVQKNLFKQFQIHHHIDLFRLVGEPMGLENIEVQLEVYETKLIGKWPKDDTEAFVYDGTASFYNLLVIGKAIYTVKYHTHYRKKSKRSSVIQIENEEVKEKQVVLGFTNCLKVPVGVKYCEALPVQLVLEDYDWMLRDKRRMDVYLTCLLSL